VGKAVAGVMGIVIALIIVGPVGFLGIVGQLGMGTGRRCLTGTRIGGACRLLGPAFGAALNVARRRTGRGLVVEAFRQVAAQPFPRDRIAGVGVAGTVRAVAVSRVRGLAGAVGRQVLARCAIALRVAVGCVTVVAPVCRSPVRWSLPGALCTR